ncbi:hypothetical protein NE237_026085 [Protea cynaroides]|uniref:Cation efflux protein transmembrane domain-containing protein n=1 Tax=Protea cynaroides TaxID=273540 RepID=A0A9Q0H892_9MAGN|nr:hypothetical protein NE237_026085 [Protea cynaroides]
MVFSVDQSTRGKVSEIFREASSVGLTVYRTWAFNDAYKAKVYQVMEKNLESVPQQEEGDQIDAPTVDIPYERIGTYAHIVKLRLDTHRYISNSLIPFDAHCGHLDLAQKVFDRVSEDGFILQIVICACAGLGALSFGMGVHAYVLRKHVVVDYTSIRLARKTFEDCRTVRSLWWITTQVLLACLPATLTEVEEELAKGEKTAKYVSNIANLILYIAKVYASIACSSIAVIASPLDSLLDFLSGFILWFTIMAIRKPNCYPIGKKWVQPMVIIVFASVMATLGLQILLEFAWKLVKKSHPNFDHEKGKWMIGIMVQWACNKITFCDEISSHKNPSPQMCSHNIYQKIGSQRNSLRLAAFSNLLEHLSSWMNKLEKQISTTVPTFRLILGQKLKDNVLGYGDGNDIVMCW